MLNKNIIFGSSWDVGISCGFSISDSLKKYEEVQFLKFTFRINIYFLSSAVLAFSKTVYYGLNLKNWLN